MNWEGNLHTLKLLMAICALCWALEGTSAAQGGMLVASIGKAYGGDALKSSRSWAIGVGGGGAHSIGSELEFSQTSHFTDLKGQETKIISLMAGVSVAVPIRAVRPYGIFSYGFIRQRTSVNTGGILSNLQQNEVGYSVGGGVIFHFARSAGVRADLRHFKVRNAAGLRFQRFMVGVVLGG